MRATCLVILLALVDVASADTFAVGVVDSDDVALSDPVARDAELTTQQIEAMVRRAVDPGVGMRVPGGGQPPALEHLCIDVDM